MSHASSSRGCATCGGGSYRQATPSTPTYDRCTGEQALTVSPKQACGCQRGAACGCGTRAMVPAQKTYNSKACPTFAISCETKTALRDCVKTALCDFLRCVTDTVCPDGKFDMENLRENPQIKKDLVNCVGQLACSFMHCLPDALCPEPCEEAEAPADYLPCGYAVEVPR